MAESTINIESSPLVNETAPILSFPAILRNPGLSDRFAHLRGIPNDKSYGIPTVVKKKSNQPEGKRWTRRKDNARFVGNPHIVLASKRDMLPTPQIPGATFPEPLPPYLSRNTSLASGAIPPHDPVSANAGRFSLSIKGMRRELRKSGGRAEGLVRVVEDELLGWLEEGGTIFSPDTQELDALLFPGKPLTNSKAILEVCRTPHKLVWSIAEEPFVRYIVHCVARYHEIVSFSKENNGQRLTYLLRPNVTRPDFQAVRNLDTPPVTDLDSPAVADIESDMTSDRDGVDSESERQASALTTISEGSDTPYLLRPAAASPLLNSPVSSHVNHDDSWSMVGDTDAEGDESCNEHELADSIDSLFLHNRDHPLPIISSHFRQTPLRSRIWNHSRARSSSSPSRSPARRPLRAVRALVDPPHPKKAPPKSCYDYVFS